jgi:hypothetical protein
VKLLDVLTSASSPPIAKAIVDSYAEIVRHYALRNWKTAGLDAGHFVEAVRRFIEHKLFGQSTPIGKGLPKFNEGALKSYESASGDESYRILIPRVLFGIYAIRNKRSIGHLGAVAASQLDAMLLMNSAKWIVAELVRLNATGSAEDTRHLVEVLIQREIETLWQEGGIVRILDNSMRARGKILVLLALRGDQAPGQLREIIEYKRERDFVKILRELHNTRFIELTDELVTISPKGIAEAEKLLAKS